MVIPFRRRAGRRLSQPTDRPPRKQLFPLQPRQAFTSARFAPPQHSHRKLTPMKLPKCSTELFRLDGRTALVTGGEQGPRRGDGRRPVRGRSPGRRHQPQHRGAANSRSRRSRPTRATRCSPSRRTPATAPRSTPRSRRCAIVSEPSTSSSTTPASTFEAPILELGDEQWQTVLDINLSGPFYYCRAAGADDGRTRVRTRHQPRLNPLLHLDSGPHPVRFQQGGNRAADAHPGAGMGPFRGHRQRHLPRAVRDANQRDSARGSRKRRARCSRRFRWNAGATRRSWPPRCCTSPLPPPVSRPVRPCWSMADTSAGKTGIPMPAAEPIAENLASPQGLAFDADDQLFVAESECRPRVEDIGRGQAGTLRGDGRASDGDRLRRLGGPLRGRERQAPPASGLARTRRWRCTPASATAAASPAPGTSASPMKAECFSATPAPAPTGGRFSTATSTARWSSWPETSPLLRVWCCSTTP